MAFRRLAPALLAALAGCASDPLHPPPATIVASPLVPEAPLPPAPSYTLQGKLLGHDGAPMKLAHVHLGDRSVAVGPGGIFRVTARGPGYVPVRFTGVDHREHTVGVFFDGRPVDVEVRLGTYEREAPTAAPAIVLLARGRPGEPPQEQREIRLQRRPDGVLAAEIDASGEVLYEVRNLAKNRGVDGPQADAFEYDGDGDYISVLHAEGRITVRLDPSLLPPPGLPTATRFGDPASRAARIAALREAAALRAEQPPADDAFRRTLVTALAGEADRDVAAAERIAYFVPPPPRSDESRAVARALLTALPPDASLWSFSPEAAIAAAGADDRRPEDDAYLDRVFDALRPPPVAARFLRTRLFAAARAGHDDEVARLYPVMMERFPDTFAARAVQYLDPARAIRIGRVLPDFDLVALPEREHGPAAHVTRAGLRGKVVLLDFWGTWCGPCRDEMGPLHEVFEKHKKRGFTIVSIAGRDTPASVAKFREGRWSMPWTHVVAPANEQDALLQRFEVKSFPTPILVDGDGRVLSIGDELRGDDLKRTVDAAMAGR